MSDEGILEEIYISSALFIFNDVSKHLIKSIQNNPFKTQITALAFDDFIKDPKSALMTINHVVVSGSLDNIKAIFKLAMVYKFSVGWLLLESQKEIQRSLEQPKDLNLAIELALRKNSQLIDIILCNDKIVLSKASVGRVPLLDTANDTGENSSIGKQGLKGIKLAQQLQSYLDNGDEIEFIIEDDQSKPKIAVKALKKLVNESNVSAILLLSGSNSAIEIAKIANKYKTPILATIATNSETTQHSDYISQLAFDDTTQATVAALYIRDELFIKHVVVINYPNNQYSNYLTKEFTRKFKSIGGEVTDFINLTAKGAIDYTEILKQLRIKKPALLFLPIRSRDVLAIAKAANEISWTPKMLVTDGMYHGYSKNMNLIPI